MLITSATFSWSAENGNAEFGVLVDGRNLAEGTEDRQPATKTFSSRPLDVVLNLLTVRFTPLAQQVPRPASTRL